MLSNAIHSLLNKKELNPLEMYETSAEILSNKCPAKSAAFLALLRAKGETKTEVLGMALRLLEQCLPLNLPDQCMDIVGTGGDGSLSINISTGAALLTAACGIPVAKHGNRAVSSRSGSADVLEALGIQIDLAPSQVLESIQKVGIGFIFAQKYHPALKAVSPVRKALGIPTLFNLLGPLIHPGRVKFAIIGVGQEQYVSTMAHCVQKLGFERALVFHGNGLDELTTLGITQAIDVRTDQMREIRFDPESFGFSLCQKKDLEGGSPQENAEILKETLAGKNGPLADTLVLNAGVALWLLGKCSSIQEGIDFARQIHLKKAGLETLEKWIALSGLFRAQNLERGS